MKVSEILNDLVDEKIISILKVFVKEPSKNFYLKEISDLSKVSIATTFRLLKFFVEKKYIDEKSYGPQRLFSLSKSQKGKLIADAMSSRQKPLEVLMGYLSQVSGIIKVYLYGKVTEEAASLIILGDNVSPQAVEQAAKKLFEETGFQVKFMILSESQFEQMSKMGMYADERKQVYP
ncbi:MAG TPA: hypothetical protein ENN46_00045 [Candidatus Woesearchaeota archaeon]|nr:hypothetical protein [Candidatus Woesearchaeota archaeon]